ncbi:hypothetical protein [Hymenobacter antarcticus]|uniref:Uncharacterized protein n=1 Tax=Hymenobacter antarcticus TaxID=486270 RepID=A0ABP7P2G5_9BACT
MDNQQNQSGTPNSTNPGRPTQNPATTPSATGNPRKSATPNAQAPSPAANPTSQHHDTANAGTERQGEGQQANASEGTILDTAMQSGKKWIEDSGLLNNVNQLPQGLKDLGNRAVAKVNDLTTTQKVVGGALLAVGLGWLATRKGKSSGSDSSYNYGNPRGNNGDYGRRPAGYQAPDASTTRSATTRSSDSGSPYGSGSRYGSTDKPDSGSGFGASAQTDHGQQPSRHDDLRSIE